MEGKDKGGKRVAPGVGGGGKKAAVILGIVAAVLLAGYVGLCAYASRDVLWPNSFVMGVDISGMGYAEAAEKLAVQLPGQLAGKKVTLREPQTGTTVELPCDGLMEPAGTDIVAYINDKGNFFVSGGRFLAALFSGGSSEGIPSLAYTPDGQERVSAALRELTRELGIDGNETTWTVTDTALMLEKGVTGRMVDGAKVRQDIAFAVSGTGPAEVEIAIIEAPPAEPDFEAIRLQVYAEAADAYLDRESQEIVPSVTGKNFDPAAAQAALAATAEGRMCRFPLELTVPEVTTESLTESLFRDTLGSAATRVTGTSDRKMNVGVAAAFLDGKILFPGEEFSFNQACSPYSMANGYGKATAYVNGLSKDTVAGGICQASSTLYWASLMANMETVERYAHRYEPSYVKGGLDATVYGDYGEEGSLDFRFKNSTEHPVKLEAYMDNKNYLYVNIYGTDTTGVHGEPYSTNRVLLQAYQTIYEPNDTIPQGTTRKDPERTGYNAVSWDTYQKLVDAEGNVVSETKLYTSKYKVRNAVVLYNPVDIALWGIDPNTGLQTLDPVVPPTADPGDVTVTPPPVETGLVPPPEETGVIPPPGETETVPPATPTPPPGETVPVLPVPTAVPVPDPGPGEAILPPGA